MRPPPKFKTFLSECVSIPVFSRLNKHQPQWGYHQVKRGLPVVHLHDGPGGMVVHLPTADQFYRSLLRSRGRKLKAR